MEASTGELETGIRLTWNEVELATAYKVYRAEAEDDEYELIGETRTTGYVDDVGLSNTGRWYTYKVQACNEAGCGPFSDPVRGYAGKPPAPTGVQASDGDYIDRVVIVWEPVPGATGYDVVRDRARDGTYPTLVASVKEPPAVDEVPFASWYWYRVRARNAFGFSSLSDPDSGCTSPCIPPREAEGEG
ncbi:fibronectin type III domain-containing protein [Candidatus Bipolaricaulota sp. J31]